MVTAHATPQPVIGDDFDNEDGDIIEDGDWTKDRRKLKITGAEFDAEAMRLYAEHPEEYLSPEELRDKIMRMQEPQTAGRRAEMVGA